MNFKSLSNAELVSHLKRNVREERRIQMEVIEALREVEHRGTHLKMGFSSLFSFAVNELGYTEGAAQRRIDSLRIVQAVPEMEEKLASGELSLENASQAQHYFRRENEHRRENGEEKLSSEEKREVVEELLGKSVRHAARLLVERSPELMIGVEKMTPLPGSQTQVQFVASKGLIEKLDELKSLLAHQNFNGRLDLLVEKMADLALEKLRPKPPTRKNDADTPPAPAPESKPGARQKSRYIAKRDRRKVWKEASDGCAYVDPETNRRCGSVFGLQIDHRIPHSRGGSNTAENLRLLCGPHNRFVAKQMGMRRPRTRQKYSLPPNSNPVR